jgi:hypothetical protein
MSHDVQLAAIRGGSIQPPQQKDAMGSRFSQFGSLRNCLYCSLRYISTAASYFFIEGEPTLCLLIIEVAGEQYSFYVTSYTGELEPQAALPADSHIIAFVFVHHRHR